MFIIHDTLLQNHQDALVEESDLLTYDTAAPEGGEEDGGEATASGDPYVTSMLM